MDHAAITDPAPVAARRPKRGRVLKVAAAAVVAGLVLIAPTVWVQWAARGRIFEVQNAPTVPVTLVLGAGAANGKPSPFLAARLDVAVQLYQEQRTSAILVSGDNRTPDYDEPTAMRDYLIDHGVPARQVVADFAGRDTYDSCVRAVRIFGVDSALVVSQGYHLPRAVGTCRAVGLDAVGVGDWTAERYSSTWTNGALREVPAAWKTLYDVVSGRDPVLGAPETGVQDALNGAPTR